uniref:Uncharacterized protein n=1 Tax=Arundo donax TaxID=35708 RepID=A0A0A9H6E3_ARUDO
MTLKCSTVGLILYIIFIIWYICIAFWTNPA